MIRQKTRYGLGATVPLDYEQAVTRTREALAAEGFGVLTEIDVAATLKKKLDVDFRPYVILGACNPPLAHRALLAERDIGLLLPCNVIVHAHGNRTRVDVADPIVMLGIVRNEELGSIAKDAAQRLHRALDHIATAVVHESADQG